MIPSETFIKIMSVEWGMDWVNEVYLKNAAGLKKQFAANEPFPHLVLGNFFTSKVKKVEQALLNQSFVEQNSDLFQFQQTDDVLKLKDAVLRDFHKFFSSKEFLGFIAQITKKKLKSIDMSGFIYDDTDYLLPHDDRLEGRKIAYIVNLSRDFTKADGGALQLFKGKDVVKSIVPSFNTFTIFEVSSKSLHQVEEVRSNKKRVSFAGWFHG